MITKDGKVVKTIMRSFSLGEISAVDRPAQAHATVAIMKRDNTELAKLEVSMALTTMTAGHSHLITMGGGDYRRRAGSTDFTDGHSHPWLMDEAGNITVGHALGHNHGIEVVSKGEMTRDQLEALYKRTFSSKERDVASESGAAMDDGSFPIETTQDLKNAIQSFGRAKNKPAVARHIKRRAKALDATDLLPSSGALADAMGKMEDDLASTDKGAEPIGNEDQDMTPEEKKAAEQAAAAQKAEMDNLKKRAERAESVAGLSDNHRSHFRLLKGADADAFLAQSETERDEAIRKAQEANRIIYKSEDGTEFRQSDDPRLVEMAKKLDLEQKKRKEMEMAACKAELEKLAGELTHIPGTAEDRMALVKGIQSLPVGEREKAMTALKAQNERLGKSFQRAGTAAMPADDTLDPLDALAAELAKKDNITFEQAYSKALNTAQGQKLYNAHVSKRYAGTQP